MIYAYTFAVLATGLTGIIVTTRLESEKVHKVQMLAVFVIVLLSVAGFVVSLATWELDWLAVSVISMSLAVWRLAEETDKRAGL